MRIFQIALFTELRKVNEHHRKTRFNLKEFLIQAAFLLIFTGIGLWLFQNLQLNLTRANLSLGFDFLFSQSSQVVRESPFAVTPQDSYLTLIGVGLLNSLKVATFSTVIATILGIAIATAQLSANWLLQQISRTYVEILRNIPLILQLFFWYSTIFLAIPRDSVINLGMVSVSIEGIDFFGLHFSAEFSALAIGLSLFASAFIAEVWRGAILSVPIAQSQAAKSTGMTGWQTTVWIIMPQALAVVIPPLTNQYVNILKNSSLAIAVGYEDLMAISSTALNQTGKATGIIFLTMGIYLVLCLAIATSMNWLNKRWQIPFKS
jgi:general L-amino acid transport system permease protein